MWLVTGGGVGLAEAVVRIEAIREHLDVEAEQLDRLGHVLLRELLITERVQHALPMYELTCQAASLQPPPLEMQQLLAAIQHDAAAMDRFVQMNTGTITPADFFSTVVPQP